ncbi:hypothetical protein BJ138DRAFT_1141031 [Hygrophoropsis aurantiaca]|uniref:Uncharacterized protein n=1 Tax=Hygrophoropsis aurantiaca TaxID=72124 RepID=A0ACB8AU04_9AGAM|nr:hypothetical protein BJ138DRAFT_1141031 [Hygrophoropsis aurantiaca]
MSSFAPDLFHSDNVGLEPHPTARDKAVAKNVLRTGSLILSIPSLATILLPTEKGQRCDCCFSSQSSGVTLRRCTGCASYWYCGTKCQTLQWPIHKRFCKNFNRYFASTAFDSLEAHEKLDALLLTHLSAEASIEDITPHRAREISIFLSLVPGPAVNTRIPPICPLSTKERPTNLDALYARCGNNNFTIHSHLTTIAHGVFPLASRLFNHSCLPNAAAKVIIEPSQAISLNIIALRDIAVGEEICIPYLDPALLQTRQQIFQLTYGFTCSCPSCIMMENIGRLPPLPESENELGALNTALRHFVFPSWEHDASEILLPAKPFTEIPRSLFPVLHESYLTQLSESFSSTSHDGPSDTALDVGLTLLALYALIYPPNYPQIGMHSLEMAKTAWNASIIAERNESRFGTAAVDLEKKAQLYLRLSSEILNVFGPEGDPGGPLEEISVLQSLIHENMRV